MKSFKLKTIEIVNASKLLDEAKYTELSDTDKVKLWKISRKFSSIAEKYKAEEADANKKLITSVDFFKDVQRAIQYQNEIDNGEENPCMIKEEHDKIAQEYNKQQRLVNEALKELQEKVEEIEIDMLSEEGIGKLMSSNDWKIKELEPISFLIE
jgi:hypothetical protein